MNQERARVGCQALSEDGRLNSEAQQHSADMARLGRLSIDSYDQRARAAGYPNPGGENVASGYRSADQVMNAWMGNDTQRRNILDCSAVAMGLGLDTNGWYWTQDFGR